MRGWEEKAGRFDCGAPSSRWRHCIKLQPVSGGAAPQRQTRRIALGLHGHFACGNWRRALRALLELEWESLRSSLRPSFAQRTRLQLLHMTGFWGGSFTPDFLFNQLGPLKALCLLGALACSRARLLGGRLAQATQSADSHHHGSFSCWS